MSDQTFFKFNLIPPKSKEELVNLEERDNSILYSVFLIFFAVIMYAVLSLGKTLFIEVREDELRNSITLKQNNIKTFDNVKKINGELFIKSNTLTPIVEQDIKLTELIKVANELIANTPDSLVTEYSRNGNGEFAINLMLRNYSDINTISETADSISNLKNFFIKNISQSARDQSASAQVVFNLTLTNKDDSLNESI